MLGFLVCIPIVIAAFFFNWKIVVIIAIGLIILTLIFLQILSKCFDMELMAGTDHVFHHMPYTTISFYVIAEKKITDFEQFKQIIYKNLFLQERPIANYHKMKQYPKRYIGLLTFWKKDKSFNIDNHIQLEKSHFDNKDQLTQWFEGEFNKVFPTDRPKWKIILAENYEYNKSAIILKIHHSYADGIGCASLFLTMFGVTSKAKFIQLRKPNKFQYLFRLFLSFILAPILILKTLLASKKQNNKFHNPLAKKGNRIAVSNQIPLQKLKNCAKRKYGGCSINDLLLVVFTQAMEIIYKQKFNEELKEMAVSVPVSMRNLPQVGSPPYLLENKFLAVQMNLPMQYNQPTQERLTLYQKITSNNLKDNLSLFALYMLIIWMELFTPDWVTKFVGEDVVNKGSFVFSSVPGPSNTIEIFGNVGLDEVHAFSQSLYQCGILVLIVSYNDKIAMNLTVDNDVPFEPQIFVNKFEEIMAKEIFASDNKFAQEKYSINSQSPDLEGHIPGDRRQSLKYVAFEDDQQ